MNAAELKTLIEADQQALAFADVQSWGDCAERCMSIAPMVRRPVAAADIQYHAALTGVWAKITVARENDATPAEVKGVCITFLDWIKSGRAIDFDMSEVQQMLGGLILSGLVTQEQADALNATANTTETITPAECRFAMTGV